MLRHKLATLESHGWSFTEAATEPPEPVVLQTKLEQIENQLQNLGDADVLGAHLDIVVDLLAQAEQQLRIEIIGLRLDSMNIQRDAQDVSARDIVLHKILNAQGRSNVLLLVSVIPGELPPQENRLATAYRYL